MKINDNMQTHKYEGSITFTSAYNDTCIVFIFPSIKIHMWLISA